MLHRTTNVLTYIFGIGLLLMAGLFVLAYLPFTNFSLRIVESGSMEPTIPTGSVVIISPSANYTVDDVVTYQRIGDEEVTTHRIVEESLVEGKEIYRTQGDANDAVDPKPVEQREVAGLVHWHIPFLGYLLDLLRRPIGFVILILIPAVLVVLEQVRKIKAEVKRQSLDNNRSES